MPSKILAIALLLAAVNAKPRITSKQAEAVALKRVHGTVVSTDLEKEGKKFVYAVVINTGRGVTAVNVDAATGRVIDAPHHHH